MANQAARPQDIEETPSWLIGLMIGLSMVGALGVLLRGCGPDVSIKDSFGDPIASEQIIKVDGKPHLLARSTQYDGKSIRGLISNESLDVPAGPRAVPIQGILGCQSFHRKFKEGDAFKAVFRGARGDAYNITLNFANQEILVCKEAETGSGEEDAVILQRVTQ